jgi:uncharacterized protein (DUF433 family)
MAKDYVAQRDGVYFIAGTRVSLDSVVCAFLRGESPEGIADSFPAIELEQVYGAIAYYLAHRAAIDAYLEQGKAEFARLRERSRRKYPHLYAKLEAARQASSGRRA